MAHVRQWRAEDGFTLFEALIALALMGLIMGALASVTGQWLPSWNRGIIRAQRNEQVAVALDRLATDLSAADYVTRSDNLPLFRGAEQSVMFVRSVLGPNGRPGLEFVRISEINDRNGPALVRMRAPFVLLPAGDPRADQVHFADPVVLLRMPYRLSFAYAGLDGKWGGRWLNSGELPASVRFDIRDVERGTVISSAARIHVEKGAPRPDQSTPETTQPKPNNGPT
ncbi:PulJ/GspJ family protein [Bradyrhizobium cajani]|uniref:General secretion pathway protein GspJ n=1 Tax=Bradyrhizobium cajani TaxID=1928661 RepID=A0A844T1X0_9BRAD|nr:prepilin-type N-terminal cleavage/methylation domain-containing protein [Bradyrhizobium cajani]MCP3368305.1 prepilin-type N-terminal cleavage/methylation domain-containing protein [Bradyrhizobium cajani]MVT73128.1 general secretion pathway protein GspJ [Bradyrhizobium cajani]